MQTPITGESLPIEKTDGDLVFAGTINESGSFETGTITHGKPVQTDFEVLNTAAGNDICVLLPAWQTAQITPFHAP